MSPRSIIFAALAGGCVLGVLARLAVDPDAGEPAPENEDLAHWLDDYGIEVVLREPSPTMMRWRPQEGCVPVYRVRIDEDMPDGVARFFNRTPERSEAFLSLESHAHPDAGRNAIGMQVTRGRARIESPNAGVRRYEADPPLPLSSTRDFYLSGRGIGPAAPDAACRNRSWDPLEDALALGWPWLPEYRVKPGDTWAGAPVEGHCNETACLTTDGVAGVRAHERTCATPPWTETFVGEVQAGPSRFVAVRSAWRDRDDLETIEGGTLTSRRALVSREHGRLAWARIEVLHRWSRVRRDIVIESIDACPGSLRSAGWDAPASLAAQAPLHARAAPQPSQEANETSAR